jgi:hypothetical protein
VASNIFVEPCFHDGMHVAVLDCLCLTCTSMLTGIERMLHLLPLLLGLGICSSSCFSHLLLLLGFEGYIYFCLCPCGYPLVYLACEFSWAKGLWDAASSRALNVNDTSHSVACLDGIQVTLKRLGWVCIVQGFQCGSCALLTIARSIVPHVCAHSNTMGTWQLAV